MHDGTYSEKFDFEIRVPVPDDFLFICKEVGITLPSTMSEGAVLFDGKDLTQELSTATGDMEHLEGRFLG